jgi:hypothetical protein
VAGAETAGSRAANLEQLKEAYKQLGPEFREKAVQAEEEFKKSSAEAAAEQAENIHRTAEASELQVTLLQQVVESLQSQVNRAQSTMRIAPNEQYAT